MGKKSRVKTQRSSGTGAAAAPNPKEMMNLISELLQKCSSAAPSAGKEWEEYIQIRALVEKIRKKQRGISVQFDGTRDDHFKELMSWAQECGASHEGFQIASFGNEGYGLRATRAIKAEELFLWVPRKMLMTVESAKSSVLGTLYAQDRILQAMGNVTLALHLLCERADPASPWLPYIKALPLSYSTPLYYREDEARHLLGTQVLQDVLSQYKNTARQYAYFYKVVQTHPTASKLSLKDAFTFDDYRWAVSSVMTRQNQVPTDDGRNVTLALIPLWDMCNHTNGLITTGYNLEDDRCECVALQDYKENDQVYIFYGTRSNAEFVIHNGFFFQDNAHDRVKIKLGVSKSERLYAMKAEVLARAGIAASSIFALHCNEPPISAQLLAFLRVFCMTEEELKDYLLGERAINKIFTLGNSDFPVSWENEIKLWTFLETRTALLLKTYKTTIEEDRSALEKPDLSYHSRVAIQLRMAEKQILERASVCGRGRRMNFQRRLEEGAALPRLEESHMALLESGGDADDGKLPIILRKLEEAEEEEEEALEARLQEEELEKTPLLLLNGDGKAPPVYGTGAGSAVADADAAAAADADDAAADANDAAADADDAAADANDAAADADDANADANVAAVDSNAASAVAADASADAADDTCPTTTTPSADKEAARDELEEEEEKEVDRDVSSTPDAATTTTSPDNDGVATLSADRTEDGPKENSE